MALRFILPLAALLAPFFLPWTAGLVFAVIGSYVFAPTGLIVGELYDALYAPSGAHWGILLGLLISLVLYGVRAFVKKRIIG